MYLNEDVLFFLTVMSDEEFSFCHNYCRLIVLVIYHHDLLLKNYKTLATYVLVSIILFQNVRITFMSKFQILFWQYISADICI